MASRACSGCLRFRPARRAGCRCRPRFKTPARITSRFSLAVRRLLHGDDSAAAVVQAIDTLNVVMVDGDPSSEPLPGEVDFLALAFSLGATDADSFHVEVIPDGQWDWLSTARPHLIVLANVASLTAAYADRLTKLVESGVGLMVFPGDQVDPDNYNQVLYRGGKGLLPGAHRKQRGSRAVGPGARWRADRPAWRRWPS